MIPMVEPCECEWEPLEPYGEDAIVFLLMWTCVGAEFRTYRYSCSRTALIMERGFNGDAKAALNAGIQYTKALIRGGQPGNVWIKRSSGGWAKPEPYASELRKHSSYYQTARS